MEGGLNTVANSPLSGRGVFAGEPYAKGDVVESCAYDIVWEWQGLEDKVFGGPCEHSAYIVMGNAMLYNHSATPNMEYEAVGPEILFTATRGVVQGEELTLDYGAEWWADRPHLVKQG